MVKADKRGIHVTFVLIYQVPICIAREAWKIRSAPWFCFLLSDGRGNEREGAYLKVHSTLYVFANFARNVRWACVAYIRMLELATWSRLPCK